MPQVGPWPRGVDTVRFRPDLRDETLRRELAPNGELVVGYVGRLAPEKQVDLLSGVCGLDSVRVVVGDGPSRPGLEQALPGAVFLGRRTTRAGRVPGSTCVPPPRSPPPPRHCRRRSDRRAPDGSTRQAAPGAGVRRRQRLRTATKRTGVPGAAWAAAGRSAVRTTAITG